MCCLFDGRKIGTLLFCDEKLKTRVSHGALLSYPYIIAGTPRLFRTATTDLELAHGGTGKY